ncbi:MAG: MerC domain-containing protein [Bacteroidia bacterium]|nr:MerC domain-containing protein [Bacteroidia bacterium]
MRKIGDWLGIFSTTVCLIHCIATPLLILASGLVLGYEGIEYVSLLGAFVAVYFVWSHSRNKVTKTALAFGLVFLTIGICAEHFTEHFMQLVPYVKYAGSGILITTHLNNIRSKH